MDPPSSTRSRPRAWQGRGPRDRSEPGFSCTWHRPSLTWFSYILPRLRADREWGAPPMPPPAARQIGGGGGGRQGAAAPAPFWVGANGGAPTLAFSPDRPLPAGGG